MELRTIITDTDEKIILEYEGFLYSPTDFIIYNGHQYCNNIYSDVIEYQKITRHIVIQ